MINWDLRQVIRSYDRFGVSIGVNYKGSGNFKTIPGGLLSLIWWAIILNYVYPYAYRLIFRSDPMTSYSQKIRDPAEMGHVNGQKHNF